MLECCSHEFTQQDIKPPLVGQEEALSRRHDPNLHGGNVQRFSYANCPECNKEHVLWLKPHNNSWRVINVTERENVAQAEAEPVKTTSRRTRK